MLPLPDLLPCERPLPRWPPEEELPLVEPIREPDVEPIEEPEVEPDVLIPLPEVEPEVLMPLPEVEPEVEPDVLPPV